MTSGMSAILKAIEAEYKARSAAAWENYDKRMKTAREKVHRARAALRAAEADLREVEATANADLTAAHKDAQRWRDQARRGATGGDASVAA